MSNEHPDAKREVVYSAVLQRGSLRSAMGAMLADLWRARPLAWRLTVRDIRSQYRQSALGILWAFIPPLLSGLLFIFLQSRGLVNIPDPGVPYPLFVLVGTMLWQVFVDSVNAPIRITSASRAILAKINFPREALLLSALYHALFSLLIKGVVIGIVLVAFSVPLTAAVFEAILPLAGLVLLGIVIGIAFTPMSMLLPDVHGVLGIGLQVGFFLTPVVYPPPTEYPFSLLSTWNPVSPFITTTRGLLVGTGTGDIGTMLMVMALTLVVGAFAWAMYRIAMPIIIERFSA